MSPDSAEKPSTFATEAAGKSRGLGREVWDFLMQSKKWWLLPIIITLLLLGLLVVLGGSSAAPFIYTLF